MKKYNYFLVCPLNIEQLLEQELIIKWKLAFPQTEVPSYKLLTGGIECQISPKQMKSFLGFLKLPSKVLRRLMLNEKCFGEEQFDSLVRQIPWNNFKIGPKTKINVSSQSSRIYHKKKISQKISTIFESLGFKNPSSNQDQDAYEVLFRLENNRLSISLNQYEKLYHRGLHPLVGKAPMREHIAASCFFLLYQLAPKLFSPELSSKKERQIIDPFCGSATLLSESFYFFFNKTINQFYSAPMNTKNLSLVGIDRDLKKIEANQEFFASLPQFKFYRSSITDKVSPVSIEQDKIRIVISNPPFFKRLNEKSHIKPIQLLNIVLEKYRPDYLCFIYPVEESFPEKVTYYAQVKKAKINFSGIKCYIYIYKNEKNEY
ncbi:hypothetical protein N9N67_04410 [Bacteriovoracaceae bacterium]|nr:hypothetical protein [Bacteriovoracaceae bacterium]